MYQLITNMLIALSSFISYIYNSCTLAKTDIGFSRSSNWPSKQTSGTDRPDDGGVANIMFLYALLTSISRCNKFTKIATKLSTKKFKKTKPVISTRFPLELIRRL